MDFFIDWPSSECIGDKIPVFKYFIGCLTAVQYSEIANKIFVFGYLTHRVPGQNGGKISGSNKCNFVNENWLISMNFFMSVSWGVIDEK